MKPGTYPGVSMEKYLALPAVSALLVKTIISECPRAAWWQSWLNPAQERKTSDEMDAGTIAHALILEGSTAGVAVIDPRDHPAEKTGAIPVGWTNKSIKAARDYAREQGKIPVLLEDMVNINNMVESAMEYLDSVSKDEPAIWQAFQPESGESEVTMVFDDHGTLCKMRPDRISKDRKLIVDVKTTARSAEPDSWARTQMVGMGYYKGAAFYRRGIEALFNVSPAYAFLVIETEPPYLCSMPAMDPRAFDLGAMEIERGLNAWRACVAANRWPGYPTRCVYPEIPVWEQARIEEREMQEIGEHGIEYDPAALFAKEK